MPDALPAAGWRAPRPPPDAKRFRSDSLDEVRSFVARTDGEHSRVVHGRGPLQFELAAARGLDVALGWGGAGQAQTVRAALRNPVVHICQGAHCRYAFGRQELDLAPGAAVYLPHGREFTRSSGPGALFAIEVHRERLAREISARLGGGATDWTIDLRRLDRRGNGGAALGAAISDLAGTFGGESDAARRALCEARVISALAGLVVPESATPSATTPAARRVADVESWIDANLAEPITLGRLCEVSGMGERTLQHAFRANRGVSPMRFLAERRLAAAHRLLARAETEVDVTDIALGVGFSHLGRFAAFYRRAYGESPSQTLRRSAPRAFARG